jgi:hypothetical protein
MQQKILMAILLQIISFHALGELLPWSEIEKRFNARKINTKPLSHVQCFFEKYEKRSFQKKHTEGRGDDDVIDRCDNDPRVSVQSPKVFVVVDYTLLSDERRMHIVNRETGDIASIAVAHGRYDAGMFNTQLSYNKNSIKEARYFSNEINSNAPSSGFFIAGLDYNGKFGRSLILHGLEAGVNDNACERAVVIHKHALMSRGKARALSSGCLMVDKDYLDFVINLLKGKLVGEGPEESGGSLIFVYGPRESQWAKTSCAANFTIE